MLRVIRIFIFNNQVHYCPDQDIALIGYTDEQHANYVVPRLSAVSHQTYKMGEAACQMLIDKIKGDKKIRQIIIPTCLQVRESSIKRKD